MNNENFLKLLSKINDELATNDRREDIIAYNDVVMYVTNNLDDPMKNIETLYSQTTLTSQLINKITEKENIVPNWLEKGIKDLFDASISNNFYIKFSNLNIYTVSPEYLLAMKLIASKYNQDFSIKQDVLSLIKALNLNNKEKVLDILIKYIQKKNLANELLNMMNDKLDINII